jgi:hypothetical protein
MAPQLSKQMAITFAAFAAAGCAIIYMYSPSEHSWYPPCPIFSMTGWQCPGCGSTRALHEMLHGRIAAAFALNPLAVVWVPAVASWLVSQCLSIDFAKLSARVRVAACALAILLAVFIFGQTAGVV